MFDVKELTLIMGVLINESVNTKSIITEKRYCCEEELEALRRDSDNTERLMNKISVLLNS